MQIYQVLQFGTAILIGILLARSGLPTELISLYETLLFVSSLFCFFWIVGGQNALLQVYPALGQEEKERALFNIYLFFTAAGAVTALLFYVSRGVVTSYLTQFEELPYLGWVTLFLLFNSPTFLIQLFYLLMGKYRLILVYGIVSFTAQLAVVVVPIYLGMDLGISMAGLVIWAVCKYIWGAAILVRHANWTLDPAFFRNFFPLMFPLLLFAFIGKGSEYVNGLVVSALFEDDKAFAIFRYGARELPLAVLAVGALSTSLIPVVTADPRKGLHEIRESTRKLSHVLFPLSVGTMLLSPFVFPLVFNADFKDSAYIFNIFNLLLISRILLPQVVCMGYRRNYILTISALVEMIVLVVLSVWWGQVFGLQGVAYAAVVAFMTDRIMLIIYNWKVLKIPISGYVDVRTYSLYCVMLLAGFLISMHL